MELNYFHLFETVELVLCRILNLLFQIIFLSEQVPNIA